MHLKRLELSGFKSFARPAKLEFPAAISAIVGPNGAGKSNVAEAMRWVLGEQSIKSLRGKKGEDLIFNGSQTAPKLGKASVSLVFDNKKKILPIDFDEAKITRKVFRDGVNEYFINNSQVRLKDIIELLSKIGLGTSSHHIISQGEADRILNASIKERRQMIEDALGLKIHQLRRSEAERKLEKTGENIFQIEALRKEIQPHLRFLKKQVDKTREVMSLKDELKRLYQRYFAAEGARLESEKKRMTNEKGGPEAELRKIEKDFSGAPEDSQAMNIKKEAEAFRERLPELEKEIAELRTRRNSLERELGRFEGMIEMEENRQKKEGETTIPAKRIKEFTQTLDGFLKQGLEGGEPKKIFEEIQKLMNEFLAGMDSGISIPTSELAGLKKKKEETSALLRKMNEREKELSARRLELNSDIEEKEDQSRVLEKEKYEMGARLREMRGVLSNLNIQEESLKIQQDEFEREKHEAVALIGEEALARLAMSGMPDIASRAKEREMARKQIERLKIKLEDSGAVGEDALKEYEEVKNRDEFFEKELADLKKAAEALAGLLKELEEKIDSDFKHGIEKINKEFQIFFVSMFGGGKAELKVTAPKKRKKQDLTSDEIEVGVQDDAEEENQEEGVDVSVSLPKKRISSLDILSGGERALTSIALLFAMSQVNPPPFLVLDETDAALDEANSQKYGKMLQDLGRRTQLILITHNRETMRQAGVLYGVTIGSDSISRLLSIKFIEAEKYTCN